MDNLAKIQKLGKVVNILAKILYIALIVGVAFTFIGAVIFTAIPKEAISVDTNVKTNVTINSEKFQGLWSKLIKIDGFEKDVKDDGFSVTFIDTGLNVDGDVNNIEISTKEVAYLLYGEAVELLLLCMVFFFISKLGKVLQTSSSPFVEGTVVGLKRMGISTLLWTIGSSVISALLSSVVVKMSYLNANIDMNFNFSVIFIALFFLLLAFIFEHGVELQKQSDETL